MLENFFFFFKKGIMFFLKIDREQKNVTAVASSDNRRWEEDCHILGVCKFLRVNNDRKGGLQLS